LDEKKKIQLRETNVRRRREAEKLIKGVLMDMDKNTDDKQMI
jgi:hypothetical protein